MLAEAIIFNRNGPQVAVLEDGKAAEIRKVIVTRDMGTQVEVDAGVKAGRSGHSSNRPSIFAMASKVRMAAQ